MSLSPRGGRKSRRFPRKRHVARGWAARARGARWSAASTRPLLHLRDELEHVLDARDLRAVVAGRVVGRLGNGHRLSGKLTWADGDEYNGEFDSSDRAAGTGTRQYLSSSKNVVHIGQWRDVMK